jgi:hypothetical protein
VLAYAAHFFCSPQKLTIERAISDVRLFIFLSLILAFLTPVLQSLTVSSSDDTVILFVLIFSLFHLLLHDYTSVQNFTPPTAAGKFLEADFAANTSIQQDITKSGSPTSLNAIFFAAILLASRLTRISSVFVLLFQSLLIFGFGPYFRSELRSYS